MVKAKQFQVQHGMGLTQNKLLSPKLTEDFMNSISSSEAICSHQECHTPLPEASYFYIGPPLSLASTSMEVCLPRLWAKPCAAAGRKEDLGPDEQQHWLHVLETYERVPMIANVLMQASLPRKGWHNSFP